MRMPPHEVRDRSSWTKSTNPAPNGIPIHSNECTSIQYGQKHTKEHKRNTHGHNFWVLRTLRTALRTMHPKSVRFVWSVFSGKCRVAMPCTCYRRCTASTMPSCIFPCTLRNSGGILRLLHHNLPPLQRNSIILGGARVEMIQACL